MVIERDLGFLRRALRLAERGRYGVAPNPMVGAVLVGADGVVVGEGWHRRAGGDHAEVEALAQAGARAHGATLYVTLEPCAHWGRTPPCADALVAAGVRRVVALQTDPDARTAGKGLAKLRAAGLAVTTADVLGPGGRRLAEVGARLNLRFLAPLVLGRPAVTLKWAMSLDGKIATVAGESRWISSPAARRWALALREEHDAIVVGSGTVLADDPRLDRRLGRAGGSFLRVVLDRRLRTPPTATLLGVAGPVLVYTAQGAGGAGSIIDPEGGAGRPGAGNLEAQAWAARRRALVAAGSEVVGLPSVDPAAVLAELHRRGVQSLLIEGGGEVHAAFVAAGLFDRVLALMAPRIVGGRTAPTAVGGAGEPVLAATPRLAETRVRRRGEDFILEGWREGCSRDLLSSAAGS